MAEGTWGEEGESVLLTLRAPERGRAMPCRWDNVLQVRFRDAGFGEISSVHTNLKGRPETQWPSLGRSRPPEARILAPAASLWALREDMPGRGGHSELRGPGRG